jgi:hypothetical protein
MQPARIGYIAEVDDRTRHLRLLPISFLGVVVLAAVYIASYFAFSTVRIFPPPGACEARIFSSRATFKFYEPLSALEMRILGRGRACIGR